MHGPVDIIVVAHHVANLVQTGGAQRSEFAERSILAATAAPCCTTEQYKDQRTFDIRCVTAALVASRGGGEASLSRRTLLGREGTGPTGQASQAQHSKAQSMQLLISD